MLRSTPFVSCARSAILSSAVLIVLVGCSFPKIIIIHDPLSAGEHTSLGTIYESQGKLELAEQQYRAALAIDPKSAQTLLLLGDLSYRTQKYSEARSAYATLIELQPENGNVHNNLAQIYLEQNAGIDKAEELVRKALALSPAHRAYYLDTLGIVLLRQGRIAESTAALKESAALLLKDDPVSLAEAYEHLAEAYRAAGDTVRADEAGLTAANYRAKKNGLPGQ